MQNQTFSGPSWSQRLNVRAGEKDLGQFDHWELSYGYLESECAISQASDAIFVHFKSHCLDIGNGYIGVLSHPGHTMAAVDTFPKMLTLNKNRVKIHQKFIPIS